MNVPKKRWSKTFTYRMYPTWIYEWY